MRKFGVLIFLAALAACSSGSNRFSEEGASFDGRGSNPGQLISKKDFRPKKYIEIIVDASGSMGAETDGEKRIITAKKMLQSLIQSLQEEQVAVAITAFGHRRSWSCNDIEQIFDMGFKTTEEVEKRFSTISPAERGKTPIAASLLQAQNRLKKIEGPRGIIVITDGEETCGGDPCKVAKELRKEMDVQIFTLAYDVKNPKEFQSLACLGPTELAKNKDELYDKMANLKDSLDKDYEKKMEGLETVQTLRVLGPQREAWVTALDKKNSKEYRFLGVVGTSLPVGNYDVTVHYNPPFVFKEVQIKEKEKKTLTVIGEGSLILELDFPGVELTAVNMLDSKKFRIMAGSQAKVPIGRYNVYGMTTSGLAFQWLDQTVTPGALVKLALPTWALIEVKTDLPLTFDLFPYVDGDKPQMASRATFKKQIKKVKQFKDSLGFFPTNAPHIVEPGEYTIILSDGRKIERLIVSKGERKIVLPRP